LDASGQALEEAPLDWGLTATFRDVNGDGWPDLYVCNDYWTPDRFWLNDGTGRYRAVDDWAMRKTSASSMGVDFGDLDRNGTVDFLVLDMLSRDPRLRKRQLQAQTPEPSGLGLGAVRQQVLRNTLYRNRGDGTFAERAYQAGLEASDWSWSAIFVDGDLDGYDDVLISAGHFRDVQDFDAEAAIQARQRSWDGFPTDAARQKAYTQELMEHYRLYPRLELPVAAFRNRGDGTFHEVTGEWGLSTPGVHHGMAMADLDGDGRLDLVVNRLNGPLMVYRHGGTGGRVAVRLQGTGANTAGIGARVTLRGGAVPEQTTEVVGGGRYLSGSDTLVSLATGSNRADMELQVRWRSGRQSMVRGVREGRLYLVQESTAVSVEEVAEPPSGEIWFDDFSDRLAVVPTEVAIDEAQRQPLLPKQLGQAGPGVTWADLNQDGYDDLVVGTGRGGEPVVLLGDGRGGFQRTWAWPGGPVADDTGSLLMWRDGPGGPRAAWAMTGYEADLQSAVVGARWNDQGTLSAPNAVAHVKVGGVLAVAEPRGDGSWYLFVGGGVLPGRYPLGGPSRLLRWREGIWHADPRQQVVFDNLGIVRGAIWTDLDQDGIAELVVVGEWSPVRVFQDRQGLFHEVTEDWGLALYTGWWQGVTAGDFNGDGRQDLVVSNWGRNSAYRASPEEPLPVWFGEWAQPGVMEVLIGERDRGHWVPRPTLAVLASSLPFLRERFATHRAYAEATMEEVLGDRRALARQWQVTTLDSKVFLNTGRGFRALALPGEAQESPAYGVSAADFDGDGHEDLFLAQNFFGLPPTEGRLDAGLGMVLKGGGDGTFEPVPAARSGVRLHGEQRGSAVADFDGDGRMDLVVGQNAAPVALYRNRHGKPGLRVRLQGTEANPDGIGAVVRLHSQGRPGPSREVRAGGGYLSQDSVVSVLAMPATPEGVDLEVRWPGGKEIIVPVPRGAGSIRVTIEGRLDRVDGGSPR
jgi:enediyne biosynthesis protein E4